VEEIAVSGFRALRRTSLGSEFARHFGESLALGMSGRRFKSTREFFLKYGVGARACPTPVFTVFTVFTWAERRMSS
jgi:hypothetical protein